ncbi:unnamed protein product [Anisakis simplex]|uniref:Protoheme IX farnesyltransferase n=1 Tax=Anisakis simplex TaxID=6269 RepID=A0A0M3JH56_ANISI|nr:unnamed protein product [Anisakis simplex]
MSERLRLVAFTVGTSLLVHLGFGVFNGFTLGFVALTILYGAIGYGMLQLYLKYGDGEDKTHSYQLAYLLAVVYSQAFVFSLFTVDANGLAASN